MREGGERKLADEAVVPLRSQDPDMGIIFRGVGAKPIPHLDSELVAALRGVELTEQARAALQAADTIRAVVEHAKAAQRDLVKLRQDLESEREKHDATLDREHAKRESAMACERAEVEAIKKATLELKAKVEADAAAVKWIRDDLMRRLSSLPRNQPEYLRAYTT